MLPYEALLTFLLASAPHTCLWLFPGGTPLSSTSCQPPPVTFSRPGVKRITLTVCSGTLCNSTTKTLEVLEPRPRILGIAPPPPSVYIDEPITLTAEATGKPPLAYSWKLPDGSRVLGNPIVLPPGKLSPGSATVRLTVSNDQGSASRTIIPKVLSPAPRILSLALSPDPAYPGSQLTATAEASGRPPLTYRWTFPDGKIHDGPSVTWTVPDLLAKTYPLLLEISNASGAVKSRRIFRVLAPAALRRFEPVCPGPCVFRTGQAVDFEIETSLTGHSFEVDWNGDGSYDETITNLQPVHSFVSPGFFRPRLRVRLPNGRQETRSSSRILTITR